MQVFIDQKVEALADRAVDIAIALMLAIGIAGLFMINEAIPLQIDENGFTSRVPAIVAAIVYPLCGLICRTGRRSSAPWVRWLGRTVAYLLLAFQGFAYASVA